MSVSREMPKYKCHKEVWALQISNVNFFEGGSIVLSFVEPGYSPIAVEPEWYDKHEPYPGGYYVVYENGYVSFSPGEDFRDGYTLIK